MARIYISSTYSDLKDCRDRVYHTLRQMRHDAIALEDYVASDQRPLDLCLADVDSCDLYIGIFAWRYGYIPHKGNPEHKSITELEYRKAIQGSKPRLIFILRETASWPSNQIDAVISEGNHGKLILELRKELMQEETVSFFETAGELASLVGPAVYRWEEEKRQGKQIILEPPSTLRSSYEESESSMVIQPVSPNSIDSKELTIEQPDNAYSEDSTNSTAASNNAEDELVFASKYHEDFIRVQNVIPEALDLFGEEEEIWPDQCDEVTNSIHLIDELVKEFFELLGTTADALPSVTIDPLYYPLVTVLNHVSERLDELMPLIATMHDICQPPSDQVKPLKEQIRESLEELSQDLYDVEQAMEDLEKLVA